MINLYQAGVGKAASTFFRRLFNHPLFPLNGMKPINYSIDILGNPGMPYYGHEVSFIENILVYNIHSDYRSFLNAQKSDDFRCIYVFRHPVALTVSAYYSWMISHGGGHPNKHKLINLEPYEGIEKTIDLLKDDGVFAAMIDWYIKCHDKRIKIYRFEDIFCDDKAQNKFIKNMLKFYQLDIGENDLKTIMDDLSFKSMSEGRERGEINIYEHFRDGRPYGYRDMLNGRWTEIFMKHLRMEMFVLNYDL